jgi:hypothetical protein
MNLLVRFLNPELFYDDNPFRLNHARKCGALVIAIASSLAYAIVSTL